MNHAALGDGPLGWQILQYLGTAVVVSLPIGVFFWARMAQKRARQGPTFAGPPLSGTAQVLSVQPVTSPVNWGSEMMCKIGVRVDIPGHPQYDVMVKSAIPMAMFYALYGKTVVVQVDSTDMQKVRIDLSQPMREAESAGAPGTGSMSYAQLQPIDRPQPPPAAAYDYGRSYASYMPPGMRWLPVASACFIGLSALGGMAYQAHVLWKVSLYAIVPIVLLIICAVPFVYFTYRRNRKGSEPASLQAGSAGWSSPTTQMTTYGEHPAIDGPAPQPPSGWDSLSPGMQTYQRIMWRIVAFGFIAAIVFLVVMSIVVFSVH